MSERARKKQAFDNATCLAGFEQIHRYHDRDTQRLGAKIKPGEFFVSMSGEPISTVLGSCVSVCVRDRIFGLGGMNHIMLPEVTRNGPIDEMNRYGAFAMEALINTILTNGGRKKNLEIKVFGGAAVLKKMSNIGQQNIDFVMHYLALDGYTIVARDVGGGQARKIIYSPDTGRVRLRKLDTINQINNAIKLEETAREALSHDQSSGDIELFD